MEIAAAVETKIKGQGIKTQAHGGGGNDSLSIAAAGQLNLRNKDVGSANHGGGNDKRWTQVALELWRPLDQPGFEGCYEISTLGRVRRSADGTGKTAGRILNPSSNTRYAVVKLYKGGRHRTFNVHDLVARVFLGPPPAPGYTIDHRNGKRMDNRVLNLEWVTRGENLRRAYAIGLRKKRKGGKVCHQRHSLASKKAA